MKIFKKINKKNIENKQNTKNNKDIENKQNTKNNKDIENKQNTKNKQNYKLHPDIFELKRKLFHIMLGVIIVILILYRLLTPIILSIVLALGIITSLIQKYKSLHIISWFLKHFDRKEHERFPGRGAIFIIAATLLLMLLFNDRIVCASLMVWAFGDSIASLVGKHYGKRKLIFNNKKHLEGTIIGIIFATIAAAPFVGSLYALIAAGFAMIIESIEIKILRHDMDDNFLVPIACAIILYILSLI